MKNTNLNLGKHIRKRMVSVFLLCVLFVSMVGCGANTPSVTQSDTDSSSLAVEENQSVQTDSADKTGQKSEEGNTNTNEPDLVKEEDNADDAAEEDTAAEEQARREAEEQAKKEAEEQAKKEAEEQAKKEAEEQAKKEAEEQAKKEAEAAAAEQARAEAEAAKKRAEQLNSFSMMYYLAITAEEIRISKDNRLLLDDIYTSLLNDINPGAVDEITQDHLKSLRDIIKQFISVSTKRERLQYIYNRSKASAIRNAVPNPIGILAMVNSNDWKKLAISVTYSVVDSYNQYKKASENADNEFLMSGWELDDEELSAVQKNRDAAFDYMVDMVQEYHLDGLLTLNEKDIGKFAEICAIEEIPERTKRLVAEEGTYRLLGNYWLELADCYFETDRYSKCLECVDKYNELATGIYRKDFNYLQVLPKAIVAAQNVYKGDKYISVIDQFASEIMKNTSTEEWSTRYFVAQTYLDLYTRTNNAKYLDSAYDIAYNNVTVLLKGQRQLNDAYLNPVKDVVVNEPDYRYLTDSEKKIKKKEFKEEQARVKTYNKAQKEKRKTELPPLYEPLILNCELLFALAEERGIDAEDKKEIQAILKTESNDIFIVKTVNDTYSFNQKGDYEILLEKDLIKIPADLMTEGSKVSVEVIDNNNTVTFDDYKVTKVERKGATVDTFVVIVTSQSQKKYAWTADSKVIVTITYGDVYDRMESFKFKVAEFNDGFFGTKVVFERE